MRHIKIDGMCTTASGLYAGLRSNTAAIHTQPSGCSSRVCEAVRKDKHTPRPLPGAPSVVLLYRGSQSDYFHCAAGFAGATSFSLLLQRKRSKRKVPGASPHDPRARRFGSGQLRGTFEPVRRKGFKLTASRRFKHKAFSFPRCARKFPHEPRKR